jgi:hypothetical protein
MLTRLIADATGFLAQWLSRDIISTSYTQKLDGKGGDEVVLSNYPVTAVSLVKIDGVAIDLAILTTDKGYNFDEHSIYLTGGLAFSKGKRNIQVSYTAGFATVPAELEQVAIDLISIKYRERDRIGLDSKALAGETTSFATRDMPNRARAILDQYRKVDLA